MSKSLCCYNVVFHDVHATNITNDVTASLCRYGKFVMSQVWTRLYNVLHIMKNNYYYRLYFFKSDVKVLILLELT